MVKNAFIDSKSCNKLVRFEKFSKKHASRKYIPIELRRQSACPFKCNVHADKAHLSQHLKKSKLNTNKQKIK